MGRGGAVLRCIRTGTAKHALKCFARLVRVLLGTSAVADEKCEVGESLVVLGVEVQMSQKGYSFRPAADKVGGVVWGFGLRFLCMAPVQVVKWLRLIDDALEQQKLLPGMAMKLAGKLYWGTSCAFKRLGRAMIR